MAKDKNLSTINNIIVRESVISGNVKTVTDIRIDGLIEGNLFCDAKVIIGVYGQIKGNINCASVIIEGGISGNVEAQNTLEIRASAKIEGDLFCSKLIIEDGAYFKGNCKMIP